MCNEKCCGGCSVHKICRILLYVGGLNWGLVGLGMLMGGDWNVVHMVVGSWPMLETVVYILVGIAAVMKFFGCKCKKCMDMCAACSGESMDKKV